MKNKTSRLSTWLNNIPIADPVNREMAVLLQVLLLGLVMLFVIATMVNLGLTEDPLYDVLIQGAQLGTIFTIPLILLRRGYFRISVYFLLAPFLILATTGIYVSNLRSEADTLALFTVAILLAGLLVGRAALLITLAVSTSIVLFFVFTEQDPVRKLDYITIAGNFVLLNGLISLFLDRFGITLRNALKASQQKTGELNNEINFRRQAEAAAQNSAERLAIMHEIDRALLTANSLHTIAREALVRIRKLVSCPRATVSMFDLSKNEAYFLASDLAEGSSIWDAPITLQQYGQYIIDELLKNQYFIMKDVLTDPRAVDLDILLAKNDGIHTWLYLPLLYQGQLIGALNLGRGLGEHFTAQDAETAQDIANQLAIAIQQSRLYEALQKELTERQNLIAQLETNNAELERFTYTVSHDLRNPLVTIKGFLGMLDKDMRENRPDRVQNDFQRIAGATEKMDNLLTDLLELSRIGRIVNPPMEIDTVRLIQDALDNLDGRLRSKNITLQIATDLPSLYGDRTRLREVFENLIENAVKYSGAQLNPHIEIGTRKEKDEQIFFVRDNGIGIEERYQIRIFALFEKLNPTIEGTGIGLALVKRIIEVHGGRVWVESEGLGKGSTFCFTIPGNRAR